MAGINSSLTNIVYDCAQGESRRNALAVSYALGGLTGFGATCLMSPVVDAIQQAGNRLWGLPMYPAQFVSGVALVTTGLLIVYMLTVVLPYEAKLKLSETRHVS